MMVVKRSVHKLPKEEKEYLKIFNKNDFVYFFYPSF